MVPLMSSYGMAQETNQIEKEKKNHMNCVNSLSGNDVNWKKETK